MSRIHDRKELANRLKVLNGILKKYQPDAQNIVTTKSGKILSYIPQMRKREMNRLNRIRKSQREMLAQDVFAKDFDELTPVQRASLASDNDILPLAGAYLGSVGLQQLWNMGSSVTGHYQAERYLAVLQDQLWYYPEVQAAIMALVYDIARVPGQLERIFNYHDIETHLQYIYINSRDPIPFNRRIKNVLKYWTKEHARVFCTDINQADDRAAKVVNDELKRIKRHGKLDFETAAFRTGDEFNEWVAKL